MKAIGIAVIACIACIVGVVAMRGSPGSSALLPSVLQGHLQKNVDQIIAEDYRNAGISVSAYYDSAFSESTIVFDLQAVSGGHSRLDVFRVFLDFCARTKDETCESVVLAFRGSKKFQIAGSYFRQLGAERDFQNPAYTIRTFPENVATMSGESAYSSWTGGALGVVQKQMEDFNDLHDKWYLDDLRHGR